MQIVAFLTFVAVASYTPGPNCIMAMNNARLKGMRGSMPFITGMATGLGLVMFAAAMFNIYITRVMPAVRPYLSAAGAAYMLWLAVKPFLPHKQGEIEVHGGKWPFFTGVMLQFINPKVIFFALAVMASFVLPYSNSFTVIVLFAAFLAAVGFSSLLLWGAFGVLFQRYFSKHETALNIFMAVLLIYCAWSVYQQ